MRSKEEILRSIERYWDYEIIEKAVEAWQEWGGLKNGYAVYDVDKDELVGIALGNNEWVDDNSLVYLYKVPTNVIDTVLSEDLLYPEELRDYEERIETGDSITVDEYIKEYTGDTLVERLKEALESYFEWDWDDIEEQIDKILSRNK